MRENRYSVRKVVAAIRLTLVGVDRLRCVLIDGYFWFMLVQCCRGGVEVCFG